jgi:hypothetical protein
MPALFPTPAYVTEGDTPPQFVKAEPETPVTPESEPPVTPEPETAPVA